MAKPTTIKTAEDLFNLDRFWLEITEPDVKLAKEGVSIYPDTAFTTIQYKCPVAQAMHRQIGHAIPFSQSNLWVRSMAAGATSLSIYLPYDEPCHNCPMIGMKYGNRLWRRVVKPFDWGNNPILGTYLLYVKSGTLPFHTPRWDL